MLTEATMQRDALAALYNYCLHQVPGMSEYGDGAKEMRAARLALGIGLLVPPPVKPTVEAINAELVKALHTIKSQSIGDDWTAGQAIAFIKRHATEAIAKAEGRAS